MTGAQAWQAHDGRSASKFDQVFPDILCAVGGTKRSYTAVEQAAILAGPLGQLTLLAVTAEGGSGVFKSAVIGSARAKRVLHHAERIASQAGVSSTELVDPGGPPSTVILQAAAQHDLLALGAPAMPWLGGLLVGNVGSETLQSFTTPLLIARPAPRGLRFPSHILVASDGLDGSDPLVELAGRLACEQDASVVLVHAAAESAAQPPRIQAQAHALESLLPGRSEVIIEQAGARGAIVRIAGGAGVSLVVMGSRRRGGLRALGSISKSVVPAAPCSVLLVPPGDRPA
jgi:nucleotide-binding universal stress UspA family protein